MNTIHQVPPVYLYVWKLLRLELRSIIFLWSCRCCNDSNWTDL